MRQRECSMVQESILPSGTGRNIYAQEAPCAWHLDHAPRMACLLLPPALDPSLPEGSGRRRPPKAHPRHLARGFAIVSTGSHSSGWPACGAPAKLCGASVGSARISWPQQGTRLTRVRLGGGVGVFRCLGGADLWLVLSLGTRAAEVYTGREGGHAGKRVGMGVWIFPNGPRQRFRYFSASGKSSCGAPPGRSLPWCPQCAFCLGSMLTAWGSQGLFGWLGCGPRRGSLLQAHSGADRLTSGAFHRTAGGALCKGAQELWTLVLRSWGGFAYGSANGIAILLGGLYFQRTCNTTGRAQLCFIFPARPE